MQRKKSNNKICQRFFTLIAALSFAFLLVTSTSACIDNWNVSDREESHTACALAISDVDISSRSDVTACSVNNFDIHSQKLAVGGMPFGVKLSLRGVIVIGISEIQTDNGTQCPAKKAGIHPKDIITHINQSEITDVNQLTQIVESSQGNSLNFTLLRNDKEYTAQITPIKDVNDGKYKVGFWIRDNAAGIGTVTFINTENKTFGGLGHGICDAETGMLFPFSIGSSMNVNINGVQKGVPGTPGELMGSFHQGTCGSLLSNTDCGVFGKFDENVNFDHLPMLYAAEKSEVKEGVAHIYCTTDQGEPRKYEIEISKINKNSGSTKNFIVTITDPELISKTGGIVQGMSGSPIIQNDKIVGAVTHVLINDPVRGYGIFIENMLANIP